jgi:hypothetical protein
MNMISDIPRAWDEASSRSAAACEADLHIGVAMELVADELAAIYAPRRSLTDAQADRASRLRRVLVTLRDARDSNAGNMVDRL